MVAVARSTDSTAEVRVIRRPDGHYSFVVEAWTNFEDAGGAPHHVWHTFFPERALIAGSLEVAVQSALLDARSRSLTLKPLKYLQPQP